MAQFMVSSSFVRARLCSLPSGQTSVMVSASAIAAVLILTYFGISAVTVGWWPKRLASSVLSNYCSPLMM